MLLNKKNISFLASPKIFFYSLIAMMIILVVGTVAQKYIGLYIAQKIFFSSFIIWVKFIPLPGMSLISTIIILNIFFKIFFSSPFKKEKLGIIITHIGIFVLLLGSAITGYFSHEGNIVIKEGESGSKIYDYHEKELLIYRINTKSEKELVVSLHKDDIKNGTIISDSSLPISLKVINTYTNSRAMLDKKGAIASMEEILPNKEDERNIWGIEIEIINDSMDQKDKAVSIVEGMSSVKLLSNEQTFILELSKTNTDLPFEIHLRKFEKEVHPGTMTARSYSSEVVLKDNKNNLEWRGIISMNNPLRYKGYTFYQSSFFTDGRSNTTILAVVENKGRLFPYISSIIICIGILIHLFIRPKKIEMEMDAQKNTDGQKNA